MKPKLLCDYKKEIRLNETSALINKDFNSHGDEEGGGPSGHYEPDGPTCGGAANRPTV